MNATAGSGDRNTYSGPAVSIADLVADADGASCSVPSGVPRIPEACALAQLDVRLVEIGSRWARTETIVGDGHLNQQGVVQGGIYGVLADATAGWATEAALLGPGYATTSMSMQLLGGVRLGEVVRADARVTHAGRRTVAVTVDLSRLVDGAAPRLVAVALCQQLVT